MSSFEAVTLARRRILAPEGFVEVLVKWNIPFGPHSRYLWESAYSFDESTLIQLTRDIPPASFKAAAPDIQLWQRPDPVSEARRQIIKRLPIEPACQPSAKAVPEAVLAYAELRDKPFVFVKWANTCISSSTWEPICSLQRRNLLCLINEIAQVSRIWERIMHKPSMWTQYLSKTFNLKENSQHSLAAVRLKLKAHVKSLSTAPSGRARSSEEHARDAKRQRVCLSDALVTEMRSVEQRTSPPPPPPPGRNAPLSPRLPCESSSATTGPNAVHRASQRTVSPSPPLRRQTSWNDTVPRPVDGPRPRSHAANGVEQPPAHRQSADARPTQPKPRPPSALTASNRVSDPRPPSQVTELITQLPAGRVIVNSTQAPPPPKILHLAEQQPQQQRQPLRKLSNVPPEAKPTVLPQPQKRPLANEPGDDHIQDIITLGAQNPGLIDRLYQTQGVPAAQPTAANHPGVPPNSSSADRHDQGRPSPAPSDSQPSDGRTNWPSAAKASDSRPSTAGKKTSGDLNITIDVEGTQRVPCEIITESTASQVPASKSLTPQQHSRPSSAKPVGADERSSAQQHSRPSSAKPVVAEERSSAPQQSRPSSAKPVVAEERSSAPQQSRPSNAKPVVVEGQPSGAKAPVAVTAQASSKAVAVDEPRKEAYREKLVPPSARTSDTSSLVVIPSNEPIQGSNLFTQNKPNPPPAPRPALRPLQDFNKFEQELNKYCQEKSRMCTEPRNGLICLCRLRVQPLHQDVERLFGKTPTGSAILKADSLRCRRCNMMAHARCHLKCLEWQYLFAYQRDHEEMKIETYLNEQNVRKWHEAFVCACCKLLTADPLFPVEKVCSMQVIAPVHKYEFVEQPPKFDGKVSGGRFDLSLRVLVNSKEAYSYLNQNSRLQLRSFRLKFDGGSGANRISYAHAKFPNLACEIFTQFGPSERKEVIPRPANMRLRQDSFMMITDDVLRYISNAQTASKQPVVRIHGEFDGISDGPYIIALTVVQTGLDPPYWIRQLSTHCRLTRAVAEDYVRRAFFGADSSKNLADDDDDDELNIIDFVTRFKLTCPSTMSRIGVPARGVSCTHVQCFDLDYFIHSQNKIHPALRWRCPVCRSSTRPHEIIIDTWVEHILTQTGEMDREVDVSLESDNLVWTVVAQRKMGGATKGSGLDQSTIKADTSIAPSISASSAENTFVILDED